jgi:fido (protein-threonine AMPylation protein)
VIEPEDLIIPDNATHPSKLLTSNSAMHSIVSELKALESTPVIGAFDANHLQQIHAHIFQHLGPRAGRFRVPQPSSLSSSLNNLFDWLARENRLKGLEFDTWSERATHYLHEIKRINPFDEGTDIASIEFFRELASENGLTLRWAPTSLEFSRDEVQAHVQNLQSANLRRLLMLVVDDDLSKRKSISVRELHNTLDLIPFP